MNTIKYVCPKCGHEFEQGEWYFDYDGGMLYFECADCDWEGTEKMVLTENEDEED